MSSRSRKNNADIGSSCPCGAPTSLAQCCGPRLDGRQPADTAEALMRARYTAFTLAHASYLLASWHPDTRPPDIVFEANQRWLGLKILAREQGARLDSIGTVEFVARYKIDGRAHRLHEVSRFGRVAGYWVYIDGDLGDDNTYRPMT